ncbi:MRP-L47-domain-containing protein [Hymenopellis radicata]|nr:MRP-L47-domain-containing protein [Hymenopellis radicata]
MFSLLRSATRWRCPQLLSKRALATIVPEDGAVEEYVPTRADAIPVRNDHGLYAFFRERNGKYETVGGKFEQDVAEKGGRAWQASELRLKSFQDLHVLWYVLLRERNLLATQKHEMLRLGAMKEGIWLGWRKTDVRKSMARIKVVMNERRLAYLGAVKLTEEYKEHEMDSAVHDVLKADYMIDREYRKRKSLAPKKQKLLEQQHRGAARVVRTARRRQHREAALKALGTEEQPAGKTKMRWKKKKSTAVQTQTAE